jgi:uncharacterized protein YcnI
VPDFSLAPARNPSGWSLRGTWACSVGLAALGALSFSPSASAHVSVSPVRAAGGSETTLTFSVPNETVAQYGRSRIDRVAVVAPESVKIRQARTKQGWAALVRGRTATWNGGPIPTGKHETFGLVVELPKRKGSVVFHASEHFAFPRGRVEAYAVQLDIDSAARGSPVGLVIAAATAAALLAAALFLGLRRWLTAGEA